MSTKDPFKAGSGASSGDETVSQDLAALDHPLVMSFVFYPRKDVGPPPSDPSVREHLFPVERDVVIGSRFYTSSTKDPVVLYFHGNGEIASDYDGIARLYTSRGMNLLVLDYRGYGRSTGTPTFSAMLRDAPTLFQAAREMLLSGEFKGDLWIMGRSLGSASALEIARHHGPELKGLVVESGFADTMGLLKRVGVPVYLLSISEPAVQFNLMAIREVTIPTLIIHGEWDQIIPFSDGKALFDASAAAKKDLVAIPRAGHNDLLWTGQERYMEAILRFVSGQD